MRYPAEDAIGRFEGERVRSRSDWRPRVPTAAFLHARADDDFWAARRVAAFSDEMIRAITDDRRVLESARRRRPSPTC